MEIRRQAWGGESRSRSGLAAAIMLVFGVAFTALGVYAGYTEWIKLGGWKPIAFGAAFVAFGLLIAALAVFALRGSSAQQARHEASRDAPWRSREDWAAGRIAGSARGHAVALWLFALVWNAISLPAAWTVPAKIARAGAEPAEFVVFLFPLVGIGLLVAAARATLRWRKFGRTTLELKTLPGVIGGPLRCELHTGARLAEAEVVTFTLENVRRRRSGSGKNASANERISWQTEKLVPRAYFSSAGGTIVPVEFAIPYTCAASSAGASDDAILWRLRVAASVAGVDYADCFEVPVFKTAESSEAVVDDDLSIPPIVVVPGGGPPLPGSKIRVRPWGAGGREFAFGMLRNPKMGGMLIVFTAIFAGAFYLLLAESGPWPLRIGFGLTVGILLCATLSVLFGAIRVRVEPGRIQVRSGLFGLGRSRTITREQISAIRVHAGIQSGATLFYDVRIECPVPRRRAGAPPFLRKIAAGTRIRDKGEAEALARAMAETLGLAAS